MWGVGTETEPKPWGEVGRIMGMRIRGVGMGTEPEIWGEERGEWEQIWGGEMGMRMEIWGVGGGKGTLRAQIQDLGTGPDPQIWGEERGHRYRGWGHGIEGGGNPRWGGGGQESSCFWGSRMGVGGTQLCEAHPKRETLWGRPRLEGEAHDEGCP